MLTGQRCDTATAAQKREHALRVALEHQLISQEIHDQQLRELRGDYGLVHTPTRQCGGKLVARHKGLWMPVAGPFETKKKAEAAALLEEGHGRWGWNQVGDKKLFRCKAHVNCPVLMRVCNPLGEMTGGFYLEVLEVAHSLEDFPYANKKTLFTIEQAKSVEERVEGGKKPRQMWAADVLAVCLKDPTAKLPEGGARGVHHKPPLRRTRAHPHRKISYISQNYL